MTIETKFNYKDRVWAIHSYDLRKDVDCSACNGKGGANIPGTRIRVECEECAGTGKVEVADRRFDARYAEITEIAVTARWGNSAEVQYVFTLAFPNDYGPGKDRLYGSYTASEANVFNTKEEAESRAASLRDQADRASQLIPA